MTAAAQLARAFELRGQGKLAEAASLACTLLDTADWYRAIELAAVCFLEARLHAELATILEMATTRGYGAPLLFSRVLDNCLRSDQFALIEEIAQRTPRESPLHVIGVYYVGCVRVVRQDAGAALAVFEYFRSIVAEFVPHIPFATDQNLNVLYRQGIQVAGPAEVLRRLAAAPGLPPALVDFVMLEPAHPARTLVCACADARYAERFARALLASLAPEDALHLHVLDPAPETTDLLRELAASAGPGRFGVSTSRDPNYGTATAYACARFFVLPLLLQHYQRPIVAVDVDLRLTERFGDLTRTPPDFDFGCFESGRREPASVFLAGLMILSPTAACQSFLAAVAGFCLFGLKLSISANWQLDQAALYSLKYHFSQAQPGFRFQVLNGPAGAGAMDFIALVTTDEEKFEMRQALERPQG